MSEDILKQRTRKEPVKLSAREPSERQKLAVLGWIGNGRKSKAQALREAGYGASIVDQPSKVFNSPAVMGLLAEAKVDIVGVIKQLNRKTKQRRMDHMVFPTYKEKDTAEQEEAIEPFDAPTDDIEMTGEENDKFLVKRGGAMTDKQIVEMFEEIGCRVRRIQHGETARHVYFWADDGKVQLEAIEKIINLYGLYAPKRMDVKQDVTHKFSLASLRKRMEDEGIEIITPYRDVT